MKRALGAVVVLLLLAVAGWLAVTGLAAKRDLTAAKADLATARDGLLHQQNAAARGAIDAAGRRTASAHARTDDLLWRAVSAVPLLGRNAEVVRVLAAEADRLARATLPLALTAADRLDPKTLRGRDGSIDLAAVRRAQPALAAVAEQTRQIDQTTAALPTTLLLPPVRRARADFAHQLAQLVSATKAADRAVQLLPPLLGGDRPRRYFVMIQQTSESRGTGGLPGGFAILEAAGGHLKVTAQGTDIDLRNGYVPPPPKVPADYVALYRDSAAFDLWQNVNVSPDLPVVARVVASRWQSQSGQRVDGVVALDAQALADILRGSGPVDVGGGQQIPPDKIPDYLAVGQYVGIPAGAPQNARKEKLTLVARLATGRLTRGGGSSTGLARGLVDAVQSGHLRMASDDPALQGLHDAGVDGALPAGTAPVAYPVVYNSAGGKLDYFLQRSLLYRAGGCSRGRRTTLVSVTLTNAAPKTGLPPYLTILIQNQTPTQSRDGLDTLAVYGTRGARLIGATLDGQPLTATPASNGAPSLFSATEGGLPVWYVLLSLPRGQARQLSLQLDEPALNRPAVVPVQPLAQPLQTTVDVPRC